jgi:hypothetical protein
VGDIGNTVFLQQRIARHRHDPTPAKGGLFHYLSAGTTSIVFLFAKFKTAFDRYSKRARKADRIAQSLPIEAPLGGTKRDMDDPILLRRITCGRL